MHSFSGQKPDGMLRHSCSQAKILAISLCFLIRLSRQISMPGTVARTSWEMPNWRCSVVWRKMVPLQLSNIFSVAIGGSHHSDLKTNLAPPTRSSLKVVAIIWEMAMSLISRSAVGLTGPDLPFYIFLMTSIKILQILSYILISFQNFLVVLTFQRILYLPLEN